MFANLYIIHVFSRSIKTDIPGMWDSFTAKVDLPFEKLKLLQSPNESNIQKLVSHVSSIYLLNGTSPKLDKIIKKGNLLRKQITIGNHAHKPGDIYDPNHRKHIFERIRKIRNRYNQNKNTPCKSKLFINYTNTTIILEELCQKKQNERIIPDGFECRQMSKDTYLPVLSKALNSSNSDESFISIKKVTLKSGCELRCKMIC